MTDLSSRAVTVRDARRADVGDVLRLVRALAAHENDPGRVSADVRAYDTALFPAGGGAHVGAEVAESDGRVVGVAVWHPTFSTWTGQHGVRLVDLFVEEDHRDRGIGRDLVTAVARACLERGWEPLWWLVASGNVNARRFYAGLGGRLDGEATSPWVRYVLDGEALEDLADG